MAVVWRLGKEGGVTVCHPFRIVVVTALCEIPVTVVLKCERIGHFSVVTRSNIESGRGIEPIENDNSAA